LVTQELTATLNTAVSDLKNTERSCSPAIITPDARVPAEFWAKLSNAMLIAVAQVATQRRQQALAGDTTGVKQELADASKDVLARLNDDSVARKASEEAVSSAEPNKWHLSSAALGRLLARIQALQDAGTIDAPAADKARERLAVIVQRVAGLVNAQVLGQQPPAAAPAEVAQAVAAQFGIAELNEVLYVANAMPYIETMKEALPFLISMDGGVSYVARFRELMPLVAANIKLNRVDFDDPLDRRSEISALVGLGLSSPEDLDPDFEGIFSGSNRSLWLGLGLRPGFAPLLRANLGLLLFRQQSRNPLVKDLETRASVTFGLSANWDALDFASKLIKGRPTLGAGGL
jgi:hypothetical protein